ncbi:Uncharacterised protein [Achromobacter sp. 2789STDY5608615]|nr:Uncharacterised protein [Achromobacter sp. 2789STDY5608615]
MNGPIASRNTAADSSVAAPISTSEAAASRRARKASPAPRARDTCAAPPTVTPMQIDVMVNSVIEPKPTAASTASSRSVPRYSRVRNSTANTASMLAQPVRTISSTWPRNGPETKRADMAAAASRRLS